MTKILAVLVCTLAQDGDTPLHWAAMEGHLDAVKELIQAKTPFLRNKVSVHCTCYVCMYSIHVGLTMYKVRMPRMPHSGSSPQSFAFH